MGVMTDIHEPLTQAESETAESHWQLRIYLRNPVSLASQMKGMGEPSFCRVEATVPI